MYHFSTRTSAVLSVAVLAMLVGAATLPARAAQDDVLRVGFTRLFPSIAGVVPGVSTIADNNSIGSCSAADAPAQMIDHNPVTWPEIAVEMGAAPATTIVQVNIDDRGSLQSASVNATSGNRPMDWDAVSAIRAAKFTPEVQGCKPVAGSYLVGVAFVRSSQSTLPSFPLSFGTAPTLRY